MDNDYPSDWDSRRKEVYQRDEYTCQNCGATGGTSNDVELHAHHIVPKSQGGTHQLSNLVCICAQCHDAIHNSSVAPTGNRKPSGRTTQRGEQNNEDIVTVFRHFAHFFDLENPNRYRLFFLPFLLIPELDDAAQEIHITTHNDEFLANKWIKKYNYSSNIIGECVLSTNPSSENYAFNIFLDVFQDHVEEALERFRQPQESSLKELVRDVSDLEGQKPNNYEDFLSTSEDIVEITKKVSDHWDGIIHIEDSDVEISYRPTDKWRRQELIGEYETVKEDWFISLSQLSSEVEHPTYLD
ncbi:HNH endonuclease [Halobacterium salinarum]|uniref:HNH endonuclease n=1 Tax=Halobacterium salinarum TaxID=2242 RepID=UPI0025560BD4|nr:HNH endonuclease [Halobacterium salinarum]MDL0140737.1 HNH endonuclease [Halobacterium salinarum]